MLITTQSREKAGSYHKDLRESHEVLGRGVDQHKRQADLATHHQAQTVERDEYHPALRQQFDEVMGSGEEQKELTASHLILSSPDGIALTTPKTVHAAIGKHLGVTTNNNVTIAAGETCSVAAMRRVSLYSHQEGMKIFAGHGSVEIQAQSDILDVIADKVLRLISAKEKVLISAPKEIVLTAGNSYIKINEAGIESGTDGKFVAHASSHDLKGSKTQPYIDIQMPASSPCMREAAASGYPLVEA
jgi:type VI secretion system secreted protein VgrG